MAADAGPPETGRPVVKTPLVVVGGVVDDMMTDVIPIRFSW